MARNARTEAPVRGKQGGSAHCSPHPEAEGLQGCVLRRRDVPFGADGGARALMQLVVVYAGQHGLEAAFQPEGLVQPLKHVRHAVLLEVHCHAVHLSPPMFASHHGHGPGRRGAGCRCRFVVRVKSSAEILPIEMSISRSRASDATGDKHRRIASKACCGLVAHQSTTVEHRPQGAPAHSQVEHECRV